MVELKYDLGDNVNTPFLWPNLIELLTISLNLS